MTLPESDRVKAKRTLLAQERSRETRRALIKATLELGAERGFDEGFDSTSIDEIAARAKVSRGTFYFHFSRKDDILLEMGVDTAGAAKATILDAVGRGDTIDEALAEVMAVMAARTARGHRGAVRRMVAIYTATRSHAPDLSAPSNANPLHGAFSAAFSYAQAMNQLPASADALELGRALIALSMEAIGYWAMHEEVSAADLTGQMQRYARILLAGARAQ